VRQKKSIHKLKKYFLTSVATTALYIPTMAIAQENNEENLFSMDEVTVTARFREESVQDVGESIAVVGSREIEEAGLIDFNSFAAKIPGLDFSNGGPNRNVPRIRGISSAVFLQDSLSAQPLISSSINEVPVNAPGFNQLDILLFDLDRVEVLKGPQGTRFGEGASGGAIRYFLKSPDLSELSGSGSVTYRDYTDGSDGYSVSAGLNVPIVEDKFGLRGTFYRRETGGFIDNAVTGEEDYNSSDVTGGRLVALIEPTENLSIEAFAIIERSDIDGEFFVTQGPSITSPVVTLSPEDLTIEQDDPSEREENYDLFGAKISYEFGDFVFESITGYFQRDSRQMLFDAVFPGLLPFAGAAPGTGVLNRTVETSSFTEEIRLISNYDGPFNFVVGAFYRDLEFLNDQTNTATTIAPVSFDGSDAFVLNTETLDQKQYSLFIDASFEVTEQITVLAGLRYFDEQIDGSTFGGFNAALPAFGITEPPTVNVDETSIDAFLPRASIEYRPTEDILVFFNFAKGARNGGLNPQSTVDLFALGGVDPTTINTFDEDNVTAYELGFKTTIFDGAVIFNGAVFLNDFDSIQTFFRDPILGSALTLNGPDAEVIGFEFDINATATEWLDLFAKFGYTDATFSSNNDTNEFDGLDVGADPSDIIIGDRLAYTPEYSLNIGAYAHFPVGNGDAEITFRIDYTRNGDFINSAEAQDVLEGYDRLDLRVGYQTEDWSITAFADNLTNDIPVLASSLEGVAVGLPRSFGITLRGSF